MVKRGGVRKVKKFFEASFEKIEPAISESFVENSIDTAKTFKGLKLFLFFLLFVLASNYGLFAMSTYIENHIDEAVGGLDVNNEFIPLFSSFWYIHLQMVPMLIVIFGLLYYRTKNRFKGMLIYHLFWMIFMMLYFTYFFKVSQLFVNPFPVRIIYTILYISAFIYSIRIGYHHAKELVFGQAKKRPFLVEWTSRHSKSIISILVVIGGLYYATKAAWPGVGDMEKRLIGSLTEFFPLIPILSIFVLIYGMSCTFRVFYVHKYSEAFRKKFGYDKATWYGPKYKR